MATRLQPDICVIGGGSGGLSVAAAAASFGVEVVLIEKDRMGGDCLNYGCVPSKALIAAARHAQAMREGSRFGIADEEPQVDFRKVNRHVRKVIEAIAPNDSIERFTAMGVRVVKEHARFIDRRTVAAGDFEIRARRFVIATGSSPLVPPIEGLDSVDHLTNETLFELTALPRHLVIIGGGPIGLEMAQAHRRLGSQVTVAEAMTAMGKEDPELAAHVLQRLRDEGIAIRESTTVVRVERRGRTGVRVHIDSKTGGSETIDGSHLLVAAGRTANVADLGLDKAGVDFDRKGVKVNDRLRSTNRRVYAVGDAAGGPQFTHVAGYHAGLAVRAILFRLRARENRQIIPRATFTAPELATVGMSEAEAREKQRRITILRWPYSENDRAQAEHSTGGLIKIIAGQKGRILGVGIVGANAAEMINLWALAISAKMTVRDITAFVPPYPTLAEIGKRAAITYFAPAARKSIVRRLIRFLRLFG